MAGSGGIQTSVSGQTLTIDASSITSSSLGDLTAVGSTLQSPSNADITLDPSGTGLIRLNAITTVTGQLNASNFTGTTNNTIFRNSTGNMIVQLDEATFPGTMTLDPGTSGSVKVTSRSLVFEPAGATSTVSITAASGENLSISTASSDKTFNMTAGTVNITANSDGNIKLDGVVNVDSHKIINLTDPTSAQDAATKAYVDASGGADLGNLQVNDTTISPITTNNDLELEANGTGRIRIDNIYWPSTDGTNGQVLSTNGSGTTSWIDSAVDDININGGRANTLVFTVLTTANITINGGDAT